LANLWEFYPATLASRFSVAFPTEQYILNVRHPLGGWLHVFAPGTVLEEEYYFANGGIFGVRFPYGQAVPPDDHT